MRFKIERGPSEIVVRLPLRFGIVFWEPYWFAFTFGVDWIMYERTLRWHLGPFSGEMWREEEFPDGTFKPGEKVKWGYQGEVGEVVEDHGHYVLVRFGDTTTTFDPMELVRAEEIGR